MLVHLFKEDSDISRSLSSIVLKFGCNFEAAKYYRDVLLERKMIKPSESYGNRYSLTPKGREYVMTNKLVSS